MAITVTNRSDGVSVDGNRFVEATLQFPASYTQGDSFNAQSTLGLREVKEAWVLAATTVSDPKHVVPTAAQTGRGLLVELDTAAKKVAPVHRLYTAASTEAAGASDQSAFRFRVQYRGR